MTTMIRARIVHDDSPESPREWDNLGTLVRHYAGYVEYERKQIASRAEMVPIRDVNGMGARRLVHEHMRGESVAVRVDVPSSSVDRSSDDSFIYVTRADVIREYGSNTAETRERASQCLVAEANTYRQWADGDVYGYIIERRTLCTLCDAQYNADDDETPEAPDECPHCAIEEDSCYGMYGTDIEDWGADLDADALAALKSEADAGHIEYEYGSQRIRAEWREAA